MPRKSSSKQIPTKEETEKESVVKEDPVASRPRRNARKNVLYNNSDYELGPLTVEPAKASSSKKPPVLTAEEQKPDTEPEQASESTEPEAKPGAALDATPDEGSESGRGSRLAYRPGPGLGVGPSNSRKRRVPMRYVESQEAKAEKLNKEQKPEAVKEHITRDEDMDVAMEFEIPHNDDGPPVLGPSAVYDEDMEYNGNDDASDDDADITPPDLEKNPLTKRRGRPRLPDRPNNRIRVKLQRHIPRAPRIPPDAIVTRVTNRNQRIVRVFREELEITPEGVPYAVVLNGCMTELLRKERIIDMLVNADDYAQQFPTSKEIWFLPKPPRLPPLTTEKMCAVFYVDGQTCKNAKDISYDELRPWSSTHDSNTRSGNIKPNVRRHPVARLNGEFKIVKHETRLAELHLTEYSARLPREQRLRKKIFYLTRDNSIVGNVLIIYDYVREGNAPVPISLPHGNDLLRTAAMDDVDHGMETESPFEDDTYEGLRGGVYLKLRVGKLGWAHNKKLLMDYMYNTQHLFHQVRNLNRSLPDLPPLIEDVGVFVYFVPSEHVLNQLHHAADGLSPWTTASHGDGDDISRPSRVRSTKRPLHTEPDGTLTLIRDQKETSDINLIETMSTLARCKRVRKRVLYIQQKTSRLLGNVCYIYEFLSHGPLPEIIASQDNKMHSSGTRYPITHKKKELESLEDMRAHMISSQESYDDDLQMIPDDDLMMSKDMMEPHHHQDVEEQLQYPDMLENGYDTEFNDHDPIEKAENPEPYYDLARELSTRHLYLTVRHKKIVCSLEHVMEWICNSNHVEERGVLNQTKPTHPPMVTNARAYAFYVAGTAIFPHDINRDDFSPWSHNGTGDNPTCYRTKVRKIGVVVEPTTSLFIIKDNVDYKECPFHLVYLYSINPKDPRLRKKIYYMMETESKMVVSHALIVYDYNTSGDVVKLNAGLYKPVPKKLLRSAAQFNHNESMDDMLVQEVNCVSPFNLTPQQAVDGTYYFDVVETDFWNDRNRQIQYLVNEPNLVANLGCLNNKVPDLPPAISTRGMFAFFVNGEEVNYRSLTVDKLVPWSENSNSNPNVITKRPKSAKTPLQLNVHDQLRVQRVPSLINEVNGYVLHTYTATLPRCARLRKKVVYVQRNGRQVGHALILYNYTEPGEAPQPLEKFLPINQDWYNELEEPVREDINQLSKSKTPAEVVKNIFDSHGVHVNPGYIYNLRNRGPQDVIEAEGEAPVVYGNEWTNADGSEPTSSAKQETVEEVVIEEEVPSAIMDNEMMVDGEVVIEHTEIIEAPFEPPKRSNFLEKNTPPAAGYVRGNQRYEAMWRIAQKQFNDTHIDDTFDKLFRLLYEKSEQRLLQAISQTFNVNIFAGEEHIIGEPMNFMQDDDQMMGDEMVGNHQLHPEDIDNQMIPDHLQDAPFVHPDDDAMNEQLDDNILPLNEQPRLLQKDAGHIVSDINEEHVAQPEELVAEEQMIQS